MAIIITNTVKKEEEVLKLLWALTIMVSIASILGIFVAMGLFNIKFTAPIKYLIPSNLRSFPYMEIMLYKDFMKLNYLPGLVITSRLRTFFLFSTHYATTLAMIFPIQLFLLSKYKKTWKRRFLLLSSFLAITNFILCFARVALAGAIGGFLYFAFTSKYKKIKYLSGFVICFIVLISICYSSTLFSVAKEILTTRGLTDRIILYKATIESWKERPLFGWGTQRHIEDSFYPAGSHSTYFAILYQQGIVGLIIFLLILGSIYTEVRRVKRLEDRTMKGLIDFLAWGFMVSFISGISECMDLDVINLHVIWLIWSLIIVLSRRRIAPLPKF
ncbi:MAG: O-antigen ligase family protein [bacterium]|nr:O-antigen ligase family protein [bacterium]